MSELHTPLARDVSRLADLLDAITEAQAHVDELKATLRDALDPGTYRIGGKPAVRLSKPVEKFNPAAVEILTRPQREACRKDAYDPKLVRGVVANKHPHRLGEFISEGESSVTVLAGARVAATSLVGVA